MKHASKQLILKLSILDCSHVSIDFLSAPEKIQILLSTTTACKHLQYMYLPHKKNPQTFQKLFCKLQHEYF